MVCPKFLFTHSDRKSRLITKYDPFWGDFEGGLDASEEREVAEMGVAYGKVIADGNAVMLEVFVEHRIHIRFSTMTITCKSGMWLTAQGISRQM